MYQVSEVVWKRTFIMKHCTDTTNAACECSMQIVCIYWFKPASVHYLKWQSVYFPGHSSKSTWCSGLKLYHTQAQYSGLKWWRPSFWQLDYRESLLHFMSAGATEKSRLGLYIYNVDGHCFPLRIQVYVASYPGHSQLFNSARDEWEAWYLRS